MEKLVKVLRKLSPKERYVVELLVSKIIKRDLAGLDCKKLRGLKNILRVRKGNLRIIFEFGSREIRILAIERRSENTYKFWKYAIK